MALANDTSSFIANLLTFLGFAGSITVALRYLDPWHEYLCLADSTAELRRLWTDYEAEDAIPRGPFMFQFLEELDSLEQQVRELVFIPKSSKFQPCAWLKALRLKSLVAQARILRIGLMTISEQYRRIQRLLERNVGDVDIENLGMILRQFSTELASIIGQRATHDKYLIPAVPNDSFDSLEDVFVRTPPQTRSPSASTVNSNTTAVGLPQSKIHPFLYQTPVQFESLDDLRSKQSSVLSVKSSKKDRTWKHSVSRFRGFLSQSFSTKQRRQRKTSGSSSSNFGAVLPV